MRLNEYNPPVILLEKKKNGDEHDWSDNGLNCTVLRNTAALNEYSPTVILLEKKKNGDIWTHFWGRVAVLRNTAAL